MKRKIEIKRWRFLHHYNLHWLVPFYMFQEGYACGSQVRIVLGVYRFGRLNWEVWMLNRGFDMDWIDSLRAKGATTSEVYDRIKLSGTLEHQTKDYQFARGLI